MESMSPQEFVRRLRVAMEDADARFTFFLGAGCSVTSCVPAAGALVRGWLPRLKSFKTGDDSDLDAWVTEAFPDYSDARAAEFYGPVIDALFEYDKQRQREIERLTQGRDPGFGYAVLAQLMTHEQYGRHCNVALTTNFDDLVADAMYLYTNKKPLVISHESLAGFVRITSTGPVVIKLHGDARLAPKNTARETEDLHEAMKPVMTNLLNETGLIFLGYGGRDRSIARVLAELAPNAMEWGLYWIGSAAPDGDLGAWFGDRRGRWVQHLDFDELMLLVKQEFGLGEPDWGRFERLKDRYGESLKDLTERIEARPDTADKRVLERAAEKAVKEFSSWSSVELKARSLEKSAPDAVDEIYRRGVEAFPSSYELLNNYALFLKNVRKDYDRAEEHYRRALEIDPNDPDVLGNYAFFLTDIRKDHARAEEHYRRALEANSKHANNLGNYGGLLLALGRLQEGLALLDRALEVAEASDLRTELAFYEYANGLEDRRVAALRRLKGLLLEGARSPGWNLEANVRRAVEDRHPQPEMLAELAKVVAEEADVSTLERFEAWRSA
jgi:Tfp pilus assembly protein PilF